MKRCAICQRDYPDRLEVCPEDGARLGLAISWFAGAILRGKYQILEPLGGDAVSEVYKARDLSLGEVRAIRVLRPEFAVLASGVRQFKHQAAMAARLQHPAIVHVEAAEDAEDGRPFLVMEYVEGGDLKAALGREAPFNAARACSIARQVAGALDVAHRLGLVHRNLSPAKIRLLAAPGGERVKVLGFGMARSVESCLRGPYSSTGSPAPTGLMIGAPQYASPEQAAGKIDADLDARSDLYSLGVLLYQMLSGHLPFSFSENEGDLGALLAHLDRAPEPLDDAPLDGAPPIPEALSALVVELLEKKRELRPATAQAVIEELDAIGNDLAPLALEADWEMGEPLITPVIATAEVRAPVESATPTTLEAGSATESAVAPGAPPAIGSVMDCGRAGTEEPAPAMTAPELLESAAPGDDRVEPAVENMGPVFERPGATPAPVGSPGSFGPIGEGPLSGTPPASEAASPAELEMTERTSPYSILFKPPAPPRRWPHVLKVGAALAAVPLAVWCFAVYRPRLSRSTINALMERYGPAQNPDMPQPTPPPKTEPPSAPISPSDRSAVAPSLSVPPAPQFPNPAASGATEPDRPQPQALPGIPPAAAQRPPAPAPSRQAPAGSAKTAVVSSSRPPTIMRPAPKVSVDPALVQASVAEGDGFFELGDYDRAIAVYERPLKIDPTIKLLQQRVARARKAKAAEEKYLHQ